MYLISSYMVVSNSVKTIHYYITTITAFTTIVSIMDTGNKTWKIINKIT